MEKVRIEDVDRRADIATVKRPVSRALGAEQLSLNYYELDPGNSPAYGYHSHEKQEELFVVQQGEVTFETESGDVVVEAGEVIRFAPGEFQKGVNTGEERAIMLGLGAPLDSEEVEILRECESCGERTPHTIELAEDGVRKITRCLECESITGRFE